MSEITSTEPTTTTETVEVDGRSVTTTTTVTAVTVSYPETVEGERARLLDRARAATQRYGYRSYEVDAILREVFGA
jgi:hypothetical protein